MNKYFQWLLESNRPKHIFAGFILGLIFGMIAVIAAATTAEIKDWMWNGQKGGAFGWLRGNGFDWLDWVTTMLGGVVGWGIRLLVGNVL